MEIVMTANDLVEYGRNYIKEITKYGKGMQLCGLTSANIKKKAVQYPVWYNSKARQDSSKSNKNYLLSQADKGYFGADCCGWIKRASYNGKEYVRSRDLTIEKMAKECTNVVASVVNAEVGMLMWDAKYTHVAIYSGDKKCIECAPSCDGLKEHAWNYQGANYWAGFGRLPWVDYGSYPTYEVYNCYWVNVRKGPSLLYGKITQLKAGTKVTVYTQKNGFAKISKNEERWVSMKCLKKA